MVSYARNHWQATVLWNHGLWPRDPDRLCGYAEKQALLAQEESLGARNTQREGSLVGGWMTFRSKSPVSRGLPAQAVIGPPLTVGNRSTRVLTESRSRDFSQPGLSQ